MNLLFCYPRQINWPVTAYTKSRNSIGKDAAGELAGFFSVGIATFKNISQILDEVIVKVVNLMYHVKHHGKNGIAREIY